MKEMTRTDLEAAFAGESQAHMKYKIFADIAEREGLANVARLFRAASFSEQMHATNHLRALGGVAKSAANLEGAWAGETFEIDNMYPAYMAVAELESEKKALGTMHDAFTAEKVHQALYSQAKEAVAGGEDAQLGKIWVCPVCGMTGEGDMPDRCPVCGAANTKFKEF